MSPPSRKGDLDPAAWLGRAAALWPDAIALSVASGESLTYRELDTTARHLAGGLRAAGIDPGRPLVLDRLPALPTVIALHAGLLAGIPLLPIDSRLPRSHRLQLLGASGARAALTAGAPAGDGLETLTYGEIEKGPFWKTTPASSPDAAQLIIGTSGSSGPPKGVMLSKANLAAAVAASRSRLPVAAGDCWLACLPLTHVGGLSVLLRCVEAGATVRLHDCFCAESVWSELSEGTATYISLVPAMLAQLLDSGGGGRPHLRAALVGGGALAESLRRRALAADWPLYVSYGMTETCSQIATRPAAESDDASFGAPLPGFDVRTVNARLAVRGPAVMIGYVNPTLTPGDGLADDQWYVTRDLARLEGGRLTILGRADDIVVSGGEKVHPAEIERLLGACPAIGEVAVSAAFDAVWGERLVAFFTGKAPRAAVAAWSRAHLQGAWRPRRFRRVRALPRNRVGKLDRERLRRLAEDTARACTV